VSALGTVAEKKCERCGACNRQGGEALPAPRAILRQASADDRKTAADLRSNEDDVRRTVRDRVRQHALPMKVSDAEWQWDKRKLTIYFTAEQRVDFRALVRDLAGCSGHASSCARSARAMRPGASTASDAAGGSCASRAGCRKGGR